MSSFDAKTGEFVTDTKLRVAFLPEEPANTPPYELVVTEENDPKSVDGHTHYLIGGDAKLVDQIVGFYENRGKKVPADYASQAAAHAAAVEAAKKAS